MLSLWNRLSIRSKLMAMVLTASFVGAGLIIVIGFYTGNEALTEQVTERLTAVRSAKAFEIEQYLRFITDEVVVLSDNEATREAITDFGRAWRRLNRLDTFRCDSALQAFYAEFVDKLDERLEVRQDLETFYPRTTAGCYLQAHYMVDNPYPADRRADLDLADGDESPYARTHRKHNPWLRAAKRQFGFYDLFLVDAEGDVIYSVAKEVDFATNLRIGPYRTSGLARLFEKVVDNADLRETQVVDFTPHRPSLGYPAAFAGAPVVYDGEFLGMVAIQLPVSRINDIMNYAGEWEANSLGLTGETVLVSVDDRKVRSLSRRYLTDSAAFVDDMRGHMLEHEWEALARRGPLLNVALRSANIEAASHGQSGVMTVLGYGGKDVLSAYAPLHLPGGLDWVITAEMAAEEAYEAVSDFGRRMLLGLAGIVIFTVLLALAFTRLFMRPVERLTDAAQRVSEGDTSVTLDLASRDEFGNLATTFNSMVTSIEEQKQEIAVQARANENLLTAKFPPAVAERYRQGEEHIVEAFDNVTVLFADLRRTEQLSELDPVVGLNILNSLVRMFNDAAERLGMEIIRPMADGYLCVCDMNSPRLDNTRRALDMALEVLADVREINKRHKLGLTICIGIEHGSVCAGIIRESTSAYDVWGRAVDVVQRIAAIPDDDIIGVGPGVVDLVGDRYRFADGPRLHMATGEKLPVSLLLGRSDAADQAGEDATATLTVPEDELADPALDDARQVVSSAPASLQSDAR